MLARDNTAVEGREQTAGPGNVSIKCCCWMLCRGSAPFHPPFPWPGGCRLCRGTLRQTPLVCVSVENKDARWSAAAKQPCKFTFSKATQRETKSNEVIPRSCSGSACLAATYKYYLGKEDLKMNSFWKRTETEWRGEFNYAESYRD